MGDVLVVIYEENRDSCRISSELSPRYAGSTLWKLNSLKWWPNLRVHLRIDCHSRLTSSIPCLLWHCLILPIPFSASLPLCFHHIALPAYIILSSATYLNFPFTVIYQFSLYLSLQMCPQISNSCSSVDLHPGPYFQFSMENLHLNVLQIPQIHGNSQYKKGLSRRISNHSWGTIWQKTSILYRGYYNILL